MKWKINISKENEISCPIQHDGQVAIIGVLLAFEKLTK